MSTNPTDMQLAPYRTERAQAMSELRRLTIEHPAGMDDETSTRFAELESRVHEIDEHLDKHARLVAIVDGDAPGSFIRGDAGCLGAVTEDPNSIFHVNRQHRDPHEALRSDPSLASRPSELRSLAETALEKIDGIDTAKGDQITALLEDPTEARMQLVKSDPVYARAFAKHMANPNLPGLLDRDESLAMQAATRAALTVTTDGGVLVPTAIDSAFILTNDGAGPASVRDFARRRTIGVSTWQGITTAGVTASMDAESDEVSDDTPTVASVSADLKRAQAFVQWSIEAGADQGNLMAELSDAMADARFRLEEQQYANGSGTGNETDGWVTDLDGSASETTTPETAETFALADLMNLQGDLPTRHLMSSSTAWAIHPGTALKIRELASALASAEGVWNDQGRGTPSTLYGYPVFETDQVANARSIDDTATATNTGIATLANWDRFVIVEHSMGTVLELVPHVFGANQRPTGTRGLYMMWRMASKLVDANAARMLSIPTTA